MITTNGKSNFQIVDEVFTKLLEQGGRCADHNGECRYERIEDDGTISHCAVGWLIPEATPRMVSFDGGVIGLFSTFNGGLGPNEEWMRENTTLLVSIQGIHDTTDPDRLNVVLEDPRFLAGIGGEIPDSLKQWMENLQ